MRYDPKKIEAKWRKKWLTAKTYEPDFRRAKKPFYNLMMFPYPSAEGLHVGNMYAFTGSDIYGRLKRMQGYDVFQPIGLDGFGIHSENYAIKIGAHPMKQAKVSEKNFYRQLGLIGNGFAWREHLETYDPEYYQWTQWIFIQMFKAGLAYRRKQAVNWCPSCKTVLADEQVIAGKCERCGTIVVKKELDQWFFRITKYAERLLNNLEKLDWSERVKIAQKEWIGKSEGVIETWMVEGGNMTLETFTTWPHTTFGATFLVVAPEHPVIEKLVEGTRYAQGARAFIEEVKGDEAKDLHATEKEKKGFFTGCHAINFLTNEKMPIYIANFAVMGYGTGIVKGAPAHDQRDFEFAKKYDLPIRIVVCPHYPEKTCPVLMEAYVGRGHMVGAGKFDGMPDDEAREAIAEYSIRLGHARKATMYHLRDWLISRQRYWAPPIPMIFCDACAAIKKGERRDMPGWYTAPEKSLPVKLPFVKNFRPTGTDQSPLASVQKFYKVRCPGCKLWAKRETDVSDVFLDSAWYYLRYPSVKSKKGAWDSAITKKWLPVTRYMGGAEHSVLHLLYVRFLAMALHDAGLVDFDEPMPTFRAHGLIIKDGAKMSKSKGNVINPDEYIRAYGADALRMYLMFLAPWEQGGDFRDAGIRGITRFLDRAWKFAGAKLQTVDKLQVLNPDVQMLIHKTIKKVGEDIENLQYNTAISALMMLLNAFEENPGAIGQDDVKTFLKLLAPFAPHITEELWQMMRKSGSRKFTSIHHEPWPKYDPRMIAERTFELVVQVNGKMRGRVTLATGSGEAEAAAAARGVETVKPYLVSEPRKVIFVPDRLVNFVL